VRRFPRGELPQSDEELAQWLYARYQEKDTLLARYYESGLLESPENWTSPRSLTASSAE
jgi:hypothetical protein